jgi:hypothetical protein
MPQGHAPKREAKKPKKKPENQPSLSPPAFTSSEVEVVKKRRKPREEGE